MHLPYSSAAISVLFLTSMLPQVYHISDLQLRAVAGLSLMLSVTIYRFILMSKHCLQLIATIFFQSVYQLVSQLFLHSSWKKVQRSLDQI